MPLRPRPAVEPAIGSGGEEAARARAPRLLGFTDDLPIRVVAVQSRLPLDLTTPREPVIRYDDLGAPALLAEIPQDAARDNTDVASITRMAESPEDLETLDAYCAHSGHPFPLP